MPKASEGPFLTTAVICEQALIEKDETLSLVRIYGRLTRAATGPDAPEQMEPYTHQLTIVIGFSAGAARGRHTVSVVSYAPSGLRIAESSPMSILFESEDRGANLILKVTLLIDQEGVYWFEVLLDKEPQTRIPLRSIYQRVPTSV